MPFHFTCPYCFKKTLVDEAIAGQSGPCAGCGKEVTIPGNTPSKPPENTQPVDNLYVAESSSDDQNKRFAAWIVRVIGIVVLVVVFFSVSMFVFWPVFQGLRSRRNAIACMNNLKLIAQALDAYAVEFGTYPPPIVYDNAGAPMHSWRVLILNHLGEEDLYARYDFEKPWDSAENAILLSQCPDAYISPAAGDPNASEANYWLVTGQGTVFPKSGPLRPSQILDGPEQTLLVVEVENTAHEWTKPIDLEASKLNPQINAPTANAIGGNHRDGAAGVFANGESAWLPDDLSPTLLDAMLSPDGGEPVDPNDFKYQ